MLRTSMSFALGLAAGIGATAAYGQSTAGWGGSSQQCMVTQLRLRIATSTDDLRGGKDNLNIVVYFADGGHQLVPNVNHGKNWPNNSVNMVEIPLNRSVPPGEIRALRLVHIADGGFNTHDTPALAALAGPIAIAQAFQSPDNWNMADLDVEAIVNGVRTPIAKFGFHRFTGSNPDLIIDTHVPPNICSSGRTTGNSGGTGSGPSGGGGESGQQGGEARPLTNSDIIRMVKDGLPQPTILVSIRSRRGAYEISNKAKAAVLAAGGKKRAREMTELWDGMTNVMTCQETNGRGGEDWCGPNPRLLSSPSGSGSGNGQLLQGSGSGVSSGSSGANPTLNPIAPRSSSSASGSGGSNTGSGGTNPSFQPLIPRDSSNGNSGRGSTKALTIDDVVKMLQAGLPEQAILASIRSNSADFNLSNKEKTNEAKTRFFKELRTPPAGTPASAWRNELNGIWEAIATKTAEGTGAPAATAGAGGISAGNKNADELSPQPYPPKGKSSSTGSGSSTGAAGTAGSKLAPVVPKPSVVQKPTASQAKAALAKLRSRSAHQTPMISATPAAGEREAAMLTALRQQKQAVQSGRIMAATGEPAGGQSTPPPGTPGAGGNPSSNPTGGQTNPNPNNPNNPQNPTGGQSPSGGSSSKPTGGSTRTVAPGAIALAPQPVTAAAPQRSGSLTTIGSSAAANSKIDPCWVQGLPPGIKGINSEANLQGYGAAGVFSQDPFYNPFWLIGCHFGNAAGRAYLQSATGQKLADFQIMSPSDWSDTLIKATLDPSLVDVFDQDNVTLVIMNAAGQQGQKSGFKFYARRQEYFLSSIPLSHVTLAKVVDDGGQNLGAYYSSPYRGFGFSAAAQANGDFNPTPTQEQIADLELNNAGKGETGGADRNDWYRFNPATDAYNFNGLKPGFVVSRFQLDGRTMPVCQYGVGVAPVVPDETVYNDGAWDARYWADRNEIRVTFAEEHCHISDNGTDSSNSSYGLNVWVKGPAVSLNTNLWQDGVK